MFLIVISLIRNISMWWFSFNMLLYSPCLNCHSFLWWYVVFSSERESVQVFLSFVYACIAVGDPVIFCTCPKPGSGFPMSYVMVFCVQRVQLRWEMIVRFVDIGGIDDYHCLNFLFINWFIIWLPLLKFLNLLLNVVYFFCVYYLSWPFGMGDMVIQTLYLFTEGAVVVVVVW